MIQIVFRRQKNYTTRLTNKKNMPLELKIILIEPNEAMIQKIAQFSQSLTTLVKGKWTSEALQEGMEVVEQGTCFL